MENELRKLAKSDFGKILIDYLDAEIKEMTDIDKIKTYDELLGKQEAAKILNRLFVFLTKAREKSPEIKKNDYR